MCTITPALPRHLKTLRERSKAGQEGDVLTYTFHPVWVLQVKGIFVSLTVSEPSFVSTNQPWKQWKVYSVLGLAQVSDAI